MSELDEVAEAYAHRRHLQARLAEQNARIPGLIVRAREAGETWPAIAHRAGTSQVAVYNAFKRGTKR